MAKNNNININDYIEKEYIPFDPVRKRTEAILMNKITNK